MIYLIGGPPKCGKTTLAKELSKSLGISSISTDTLQSVVKSYIDKETFLKKFPASSQREKDNDEKYLKYSSAEIIAAYQQQAKTVYPAIEMFVACEIADSNDFIVEGYHIEPELVSELSKKYPNNIRSIFLFKSDKEKFVCDIKKSSTPNDWIIARTNNEETYPKIADMVCEYGYFFEKESKKYDFKILNMDSDFDNQIKEGITYLVNV